MSVGTRPRATAAELRALGSALDGWANQLGGNGLGGIVRDEARGVATAANAAADALHAGWRPDDAIARFGAATGRLWREICRSAGAAAGRRITHQLLDSMREPRS